MRFKHIIITGVALSTLFGCGTSTSDSVDNRQLDNIENVRNNPAQTEDNFDRLNQVRGGPRAPIENNQNRTRQNNIDSPGREFNEDGLIDRDQSNNLTGDRKNYDKKRNNQDNEYRVSEKIAERITSEVKEIDRAYVLTLGNSAYVACQIDRDQSGKQNNDLSDQLEKKVTEAVKDVDNDIENVYVSSNPDFIDLASNYIRDVDRGQPIEGFFDQFTEMIDRVFPSRNR